MPVHKTFAMKTPVQTKKFRTHTYGRAKVFACNGVEEVRTVLSAVTRLRNVNSEVSLLKLRADLFSQPQLGFAILF